MRNLPHMMLLSTCSKLLRQISLQATQCPICHFNIFSQHILARQHCETLGMIFRKKCVKSNVNTYPLNKYFNPKCEKSDVNTLFQSIILYLKYYTILSKLITTCFSNKCCDFKQLTAVITKPYRQQLSDCHFEPRFTSFCLIIFIC
jgi:hypothetical protein